MTKLNNGWSPERLVEELSRSIKGQERYLKDLALVLWLHYLRKEQYSAGEESGFPKVNMMVLGKSGTGKTSSIRAMAELLNMPVIIEDASQFTASGWKGRNVSEIACRIADEVQDDVDKRFAIVVLDEIDKAYNNGNHNEANSPVNNLLKLIEGMRLEHRDSACTATIETENILFICLGAFEGIENTIRKRISPAKRTIGFIGEPKKEETDETDLLCQVKKEDLISYGISPQLLGRIGLITATNDLKAEDLEEIILNSDISAVKQFNKLLTESQGVDVSITPAAAKHIAEAACSEKTGARALSEKLFTAYKNGLYSIADKDSVNAILLDAKNGELTIKYGKGKRHRKNNGKDIELYEQVPLNLSERTAKGAVLWSEALVDGMAEHLQGIPYNTLRAVVFVYTHVIIVLLNRGRKDPTMADVEAVLHDLMGDSINGSLRGKSKSLDKAYEYTSRMGEPLQTAREILHRYCRKYVAEQEEKKKKDLKLLET